MTPMDSFIARRLWAVVSIVALAVVAGCGGSGEADLEAEMRTLVETGRWDEILARAEILHAEGVDDPSLDRAEGLALLHQDADAAAEAPLDRALAARPEYGASIARVYRELAFEDHEAGWSERAKRRIARALVFDPTVETGELTEAAADWFYRYAKDHRRALPLYAKLSDERPEPVSRHPEWTFRYGYALEAVGRVDEALDVYAEFERRYPTDLDHMRFVQWRVMNLRIERARNLIDTAQPERALEELRPVLSSTWHRDLRQQARVVAGAAEEANGNLEAARDWYATVVEEASEGAAGPVREARERLRALGELGVH